MKAGWRTEPLNTVCQLVTRGVSPSYVDNGGVAVLNQKCVRDHTVNFDLGRRHDSAKKKVSTDKFLRAGDVLVNSTGTGTLGRVAQLRDAPIEPTTVDSHITIVRPKDGFFFQEFFGYALIAIEEKIQEGGEGCGGQTELARSKLANDFHISFPEDIGIQQRIVAILDEAFDGIAIAKANAKKNVENARAIFLSQRELLLSPKQEWSEAPLAELCDVKHGYAFEGEFFKQDGEYVLLTPGSFFETGGYRERGEKTKYFVGQIPSNYILGMNDLLVAMTEQAAGLLGSPLLVPEPNRFLHNQRLGLVTGKPGVLWLNEFFFHVFNLGRVRQEIHSSASGVKVRHTSPGRIGAVRVSFPNSVEEQRRIANILGDLSEYCQRLDVIYQRKIACLDDLRKSLLYRAFNGDL